MSVWCRVCLVTLLVAVLLIPSNAFAATTVKGRAYVQNANNTYIILTFTCTNGGSITGNLVLELGGVDHPATIQPGSAQNPNTCAVPSSDGTLALNAQAQIKFADDTTRTLTLALNGVRSQGKTFTTNTTDCTSSPCISMTITPQTSSLSFTPTATGNNFGTTTLSTH